MFARSHISALTAVILVFTIFMSGCGPIQTISTTNYTFGEQQMADSVNAVVRSEYSPIDVPHGEDYIIEWKDAGMEAHMRFILGRDTGAIYHSDVWDIQVLAIQPANGVPHDVALSNVVEGFETFCFESIFLSTNMNYWHVYDGKRFPAVESLQDLQHFDSLQIFFADLTTSEGKLTDISGVEQCKYLKDLSIYHAQLTTLNPLAEAKSLEDLDLLACGLVDLQPLEYLPSLSEVSLRNCDIISLEPLTTLPALRYLSIGLEALYPSLEPLQRTSVEYLDMSLSMSGRDKYQDLDYKWLSSIESLKYLALTNHSNVDVPLCDEIISRCKELKYLDISYTSAAKDLSDNMAELNTENLAAFICIPD